MTSNYNTNQLIDEGYEYFMDEVKHANVESKLNRIHDDMKFIYEDLDCQLGLLPYSLISPYGNGQELNHRHHANQNNHFHCLQQEPHQLYSGQQRRHYYNGNIDKHMSLQHISNKFSPPPKSVQVHYRNRQNNNYQRNADHLIEDQQRQRKLEYSNLQE